MRKEMEAGQWRGMDKDKAAQDQAAGQGSAKVAPKPYMSAQYKEATMRTTGNATSPDAATAHEPTRVACSCHTLATIYGSDKACLNLLACIRVTQQFWPQAPLYSLQGPVQD